MKKIKIKKNQKNKQREHKDFPTLDVGYAKEKN